jgi:hypothetical protein
VTLCTVSRCAPRDQIGCTCLRTANAVQHNQTCLCMCPCCCELRRSACVHRLLPDYAHDAVCPCRCIDCARTTAMSRAITNAHVDVAATKLTECAGAIARLTAELNRERRRSLADIRQEIVSLHLFPVVGQRNGNLIFKAPRSGALKLLQAIGARQLCCASEGCDKQATVDGNFRFCFDHNPNPMCSCGKNKRRFEHVGATCCSCDSKARKRASK